MSGKPGGFRAAEMDALHMEKLHAAPMRVECAFCSWKAEGEAGDLLVRQQRHRLRRHGIERISRRKFKHLGTFRQPNMTEQDMADVQAERKKRMYLNGIEAA